MAEFSQTIPRGETVSGTFRAKVNAGDEITLSVDCAGMLTCTDCGVNLRADANETNDTGEIIGVPVVSATATATGTFVFQFSAYNATGPGHITASGFESVIVPLSVAPTSLNFDKAGGMQGVSVSGSFESLQTTLSGSWISESLSDTASGISVSENSSIRRGGHVTITATMTDGTIETATVNVEQAGEAFKVVPTVWNVGNGGGARTLSVSPDNVEILVDSGADWATYSNKAIRAAANLGDARTATLTVYANAPESPVREYVPVVVNQEAASESGSNTGSGSTGGSSGTDGNTAPSGASGNGGRVGTVIFRNAKGATLNFIVTQNP